MKPVTAFASNLLLELARKRSHLVFAVLVVAAAVVLPGIAGGDAASLGLRAKLQLTARYGLGLSVFLLAAGTLWIAAGTVAGDIEERRLHPVVTKPCAMWQLVLGRWLGVMAPAGLLLLLVLLVFGVHLWIAQAGDVPASQAELARDRFFTQRVALRPEVPQVSEEALRAYVDGLLADPETARSRLRSEIEAQARRVLRLARVEPGGSARLRIPDLARHTGREGRLYLSCTVHCSPPAGAPQSDIVWEIREDRPGDAEAALLHTLRMRVSAGLPHEVALPGAVVPAEGGIILTLRNPEAENPGRTLLVDPLAVEILVPYGSFWAGIARDFGLLLAQFGLLAAMGLLASCAFSSPTAILVVLFTYVTSLSSGFLIETFERELLARPRTFTDAVSSVLSRIGSHVLRFFPDLGTMEPLQRITDGRACIVPEFSAEMAWMLGVQVSLLLILAACILRSREIAREVT